jgi:hypothetical protein
MKTPCAACLIGPKSTLGHSHLTSAEDTLFRAPLAFTCATCASIWNRQYVGAGTFAWSRQEAPRDLEAA